MVGVPPRVARPPFAGRRICLGVTGGIAAYKAIGLARDLTLAGAEVDMCLSESSLQFVAPLSFEALTGRAVHQSMYVPGDPLLHIRLARESDLIIVAPATANFIARAANGMADDLLTAVLLATGAQVLVCPAMNDRMYAHPQTQANVSTLSTIGYHLAGPVEGPLAWGEGTGLGRMLDPEAILAHAGRLLSGKTELQGKKVVVTAGPTREAMDPVRFLGNRSSGKMGYSIAEEAWMLGADVILISGPTSLPLPTGVKRIDVQSAAEMHEAVSEHISSADAFIMAAAVADFRPVEVASDKIKKNGGDPMPIVLSATEDILRATIGKRKSGSVTVGFALETTDLLENAKKKLAAKELDLLILNDAGEPGAGFEVDTNRVTILDPSGGIDEQPLLGKDEVARRILDRVSDLLSAS